MINEQDIQNLENVFTLARQSSVNNKQVLKDLLMYEEDLLKRLTELLPKKEEENNLSINTQ
jgi:hypothetical protein